MGGIVARPSKIKAIDDTATGCLTEPNNPQTRACKAAGLEGLTLHGLRRSFKNLTEWLEVPIDMETQIQGNKPSATAEKHDSVRPLKLLRVHFYASRAGFWSGPVSLWMPMPLRVRCAWWLRSRPIGLQL